MPDTRNITELNMPPVTEAFENYQFLGNEFLTWLWFCIENEPQTVKDPSGNDATLMLHKKVVLKKTTGKTVSITIQKDSGEEAEEGMLALKGGAIVTELSLLMNIGDVEWTFSIKGDSFHFNSLKPSVEMPDAEPVEPAPDSQGPEQAGDKQRHDFEASVLDRTYLYIQAVDVLDGLFKKYVLLRLSDDWEGATVPAMKKWIAQTA
jgi:hypothetical protein